MKTFNEIQHSKNELINGNDIDIETKDKEDLRIATISFNSRTNRFGLWFNGSLLKNQQSFSGIIRRLKKLHTDWDLELA